MVGELVMVLMVAVLVVAVLVVVVDNNVASVLVEVSVASVVGVGWPAHPPGETPPRMSTAAEPWCSAAGSL